MRYINLRRSGNCSPHHVISLLQNQEHRFM